MSMPPYVQGFRPPDDTFEKMRAVWDACKTADVEVPDRVLAFFGGQAPDPAGVVVEIHHACRRWKKGDDQEGFEVDLTKLDPTIKILRFINAY